MSMEEGTELHDATVKELPPCKYGDQCYRKNPDHLLKFSHGKNTSSESMTSIGSDDKPIEQVGNGTDGTSDTAAAETSRDDRIIILMLVGVPGSGKSTFCSALLQDAQSYWIRVCQDVVANGKRGTKEQCLKQVRSALLSSKNVLIDRCNVSKEQRNMFVAFGKEANVEMHALVLALPAGLCIRRAMQRTSHEGDLQGKKVGAVVQRMAQDMEMPSVDEGFVRITVCRKESDVERALLLYKNIEAVKRLPHGLFDDGQNTKGTLKHFLQTSKSNPPVEFKKSTGNNISQNSFIQHGRLEREENIGSAGDRTLAFPSISTADFQFDHEKAADIIVDSALHFLSKKEHQALKLVLVDLFADSDMLLRVSKKAVAVGLDGKRFLTFVGDITRLHSMGGPACHIIANAANWRLKSGGGGVNLAIFKAAGPEFEQATKDRAKVLNPGSALIVPVPNSSPLYLTEGVTHVIHVLGPNMNLRRPNYLNGDYVQGCQVLRETYNCLFESFAFLARRSITDVSGDMLNMQGSSNEITGGQEDNHMGCVASKDCYTSSEPVKTFGNMSLSKNQSPAPNAFTILMQSAKRKSSKSGAADSKRGKNFDGEVDTSINKDKHGEGSSSDGMGSSGLAEVGSIRAPVDHVKLSGTGIKWPAWAQALHNIALHPEEHQKTLLQITNEAVVMPDLYPKARKHFLVLARADGLNSIGDLRREHLPLLRHMHSLGEGWISKFWKEDPSLFFRLGYHWMPSMRQLHLHVVSQDFDSPHLKNKKHWNSFTTIFFRDSKNVILEIEEHEKVNQCNKETEELLLSQELRCHRCKSAHPNIPRLKNHIASCTKPFSSDIPILLYKEFSST